MNYNLQSNMVKTLHIHLKLNHTITDNIFIPFPVKGKPQFGWTGISEIFLHSRT